MNESTTVVRAAEPADYPTARGTPQLRRLIGAQEYHFGPSNPTSPEVNGVPVFGYAVNELPYHVHLSHACPVGT